MALADDFENHPAVQELREALVARGFPIDRRKWTVIPPEGTRLRCNHEPPCDYHRSGGSAFQLCRWVRLSPAAGES